MSSDTVASGADDIPTDDPVASTGGSRVDAGGQDAAAERAVDEEHLFHLLRSDRRRVALRFLMEAGGEPVELRDLAAAVAAEENGTPVDELGSEARRRAYIPLYQSHLPQLEQAGFVEYHRDRGAVEATALVEAFEPYLDADPGAAEGDAGARLAPFVAGAGVGVLSSLALTWALGTTGGLLVVLLAVVPLVYAGLTRWR